MNMTMQTLSCRNDHAVLGASWSAQLLGASKGQLLVCAGGLNFKQSQLGVIHPIHFAGKSRAIWLKHLFPIELRESLTTSLAGEKDGLQPSSLPP